MKRLAAGSRQGFSRHSTRTPPLPPELSILTKHLAIRGVSKTYPNGVRALHDVTLDIPGGMYGLLGPNGAGTFTLMRTVATLQEPDTGSITLGDPAGAALHLLSRGDWI